MGAANQHCASGVVDGAHIGAYQRNVSADAAHAWPRRRSLGMDGAHWRDWVMDGIHNAHGRSGISIMDCAYARKLRRDPFMDGIRDVQVRDWNA